MFVGGWTELITWLLSVLVPFSPVKKGAIRICDFRLHKLIKKRVRRIENRGLYKYIKYSIFSYHTEHKAAYYILLSQRQILGTGNLPHDSAPVCINIDISPEMAAQSVQ